MPRRSARHAKLVKVASYYVLFAALESMVMAGFSIAAVVGFKSSAWVVVGGLASHGVFDALQGQCPSKLRGASLVAGLLSRV